MRQLLVSSGVAASYTANVLATGAIDVVGESDGVTGFTSLLPGQTISDYSRIRIIQGTALGNIVSPWIEGKDVASWTGGVSTPQTPQVFTVTLTTNLTAAGDVMFKLIEKHNGQAQFVRKSANISGTAGQTPAQLAQDIVDSLCGLTNAAAATAHTVLGMGGATIEYTNAAPSVIEVNGSIFSLTADTELSNIAWSSEGIDGTNGMTSAFSQTANPSLGYGDGEVLAQYERSLQGDLSFYYRITQPNTPAAHVVVGTAYDVYNIGVKNSTPGSIHGVDNFRSISISRDSAAAAAVITAFEGVINPWMNSCPGNFIAVQL